MYRKLCFATAAVFATTLVGPVSAEPESTDSDRYSMDTSLILEGIYLNRAEEGNATPAGFGDDHGHDHGHDHGLEEGFNLGHSELVFDARLGDLADGTLNIGFSEEELEVEEAYVVTRSLPAGFQLKGGKFL